MKHQFPLVRGSSVIIFSIAMLSVVGHLSGKQNLYTWIDGHAGMGLPTAICFIVSSWSLFTLGRERSQQYDKEQSAENRS
jgi:hypothetical protein